MNLSKKKKKFINECGRDVDVKMDLWQHCERWNKEYIYIYIYIYFFRILVFLAHTGREKD